MNRYADLLRRLDAGEVLDPTSAITPAGGPAIRSGMEARAEHARRVTPDERLERRVQPKVVR